MEKLMSVLACALYAAFGLAGDFFPGKVTLAAGATNGQEDVVLVKQFGDGATALDRFTATVTSGSGTGIVYLVSVDHGIETALANSTALSTTTLYDAQPKRAFVTTETVPYVIAITGGVTQAGANLSVCTNRENYMLRAVRVKVVQPAASDATVYSFGVFGK